MMVGSSDAAAAVQGLAAGPRQSVAAQLGGLARGLIGSPHRLGIALLAAGAVAVVATNTAGQVWLNRWNGAFYDAIGQRDLDRFLHELLVFAGLASFLLVMVVAQTWLVAMLKVRLRAWLSHDLLDRWLVTNRAYRMTLAGEIGTNPDQRVQEDARRLTELTAELAAGLLQSSLLLVTFVGVLWQLSAQASLPAPLAHLDVPGYLVWCAIGYALLGSAVTWWVGRPLVRLNAERYAREASFRFALVRISECAEAIALYRGEADERRGLERTLEPLIAVMGELAWKLARLTWVTSGYGWIAIVLPIVVAAPGYFAGELSLGGMMMIVNAFFQVQQSLRWFVDNFATIADWRAALGRVTAFRDALASVERLAPEVGRLTLVEDDAGDQLTFENVELLHPEGCAALEQGPIRIAPGERVLIVGEAGSGKSTLFRAMAGLWPWGGGTIRMPPRSTVMFLPQRPYLPLGSLRAAVSYPAPADRFGQDAIAAALARVGLAWLVPSLDVEHRWDRDLSLDQQQRLAFARLLLHRPRWVFLDEATSALPEDQLALMESILRDELAAAAVIGLARRPPPDGFYTRIVRLRLVPTDRCLPIGRPATAIRHGAAPGPAATS